MRKIVQNQQIPPKKGKKLDKSWKIYFKKEGCSMLLFKDLTCFQAVHRVGVLKKMYTNWMGSFIVTK